MECKHCGAAIEVCPYKHSEVENVNCGCFGYTHTGYSHFCHNTKLITGLVMADLGDDPIEIIQD